MSMSSGGMASHIAKMVMRKLAKGGMVNAPETLDEANDFEIAKEDHEADPMDNETMPMEHDTDHDDAFSDEEKPMKGRLHRIMANLHWDHMRR